MNLVTDSGGWWKIHLVDRHEGDEDGGHVQGRNDERDSIVLTGEMSKKSLRILKVNRIES